MTQAITIFFCLWLYVLIGGISIALFILIVIEHKVIPDTFPINRYQTEGYP